MIFSDVKAENILFETEDSLSPIQLIDFGLATEFARGGFLFERVGTVRKKN